MAVVDDRGVRNDSNLLIWICLGTMCFPIRYTCHGRVQDRDRVFPLCILLEIHRGIAHGNFLGNFLLETFRDLGIDSRRALLFQLFGKRVVLRLPLRIGCLLVAE